MFEDSGCGGVENEVCWAVQYVYDPDRHDGAFAYTVGLAQSGHPELFMRAAPEQEPCEAPWYFSARDCTAQLNRFARSLIEGKLVVGQPISESFDAGATTVVFTPGAPVDPYEVEAYGVDPGSWVIPFEATLVSAAPSPLADLPRSELPRWRGEVACVLSAVPPNRRSIMSVRRPEKRDSFSHTGEFGPMTPLVRAYAYAVAKASPEELAALLIASIDADTCFGPKLVLGVSYTQARLVSRMPAAWNAEHLANQLVGALHERPRLWQRTLKRAGLFDDPTTWHGASRQLTQAISAMLVAATVADRLDDDTTLAAFGPWNAAAGRPLFITDDRWRAPAHVISVVRDLVERIDAESAHLLLKAWDSQCESATVALLRGLAVTGRRACPPPHLLVEDSYLATLAASGPVMAEPINDLLCCLTAVLCERARLTTQQVREFAAPLADALPGLEEVLNAPILAESA
ncbi:DUF4262 domain-containing protein [Hoyosella sp. YIM 151337]|uniref:DUF4262 domain-containing protein n=1 Tax=Hoyosella sp. YIM 151337 TaxID=2992742 RepID=UPI002236075A|nr:DUF4262 domain-containing protein [Hoyosella sp. YIM 151337]MCW4354545.1 DUF4262 domain-containing protein [Hoyosella sp. YIM 151337]